MTCCHCADDPITSPCRECGMTRREADMIAANRELVKHLESVTEQRDELQRQLSTITQHIRIEND